MLKLRFKVSPTFLVSQTLLHDLRPEHSDEAVTRFKRKYTQGSGSHFYFPERFSPEPNIVFKEMAEDPLFAPILEKTQASLEIVQSEWESNCERTSAWMESLTPGLELKREIVVLLTHPHMPQGCHLTAGLIAWSHTTKHNENTIYLWHEILHDFLPKTDRAHALIELLTDNELRKRLNGNSYPPWSGHKFLDKLRTEMLQSWRAHLLNPGNIWELLEESPADTDQ